MYGGNRQTCLCQWRQGQDFRSWPRILVYIILCRGGCFISGLRCFWCAQVVILVWCHVNLGRVCGRGRLLWGRWGYHLMIPGWFYGWLRHYYGLQTPAWKRWPYIDNRCQMCAQRWSFRIIGWCHTGGRGLFNILRRCINLFGARRSTPWWSCNRYLIYWVRARLMILCQRVGVIGDESVWPGWVVDPSLSIIGIET